MNYISGFREIKARKTRFGFKIDYFSVKDIIPTGKLLEDLTKWKDELYRASFTSTASGTSNFEIHTDNEIVAEHIREIYVDPANRVN
jgi:hypothetical protein